MLPNNFLPKKKYDLIRLGSANDGGYLVEKKSIDQAKTLLSFGISNDWNFESDFYRHNRVTIEAFDPTIPFTALLKIATLNLAKVSFIYSTLLFGKKWDAPYRHYQFNQLKQSIKAILSYHCFFRKDKKLHPIAVGDDGKNSISLEKIVDNYKVSSPVFVKCDIEGDEYKILDALIEKANQTTGCVIEFHEVDLHLHQIEDFIEKYPLDLVHIHPNNCGETDKNGNPAVLELSFSKDAVPIGENSCLPHDSDSPNALFKADIPLTFSKD